MGYKPKIIAGKVKDTGYPIDGHVLYFALWDYDRDCWHLYGWEDADDEAVMLTVYETEREEAEREQWPIMTKDDFAKRWKAKEWEPRGVFCVPLEAVEVVEVKQEEEKDEARDKLIANGFDLTPRRSTDKGGILCLPLDENLNGDTKAKHPDWELIECPNCGRGCWKVPEAAKMQEQQGVQFLCTACALEAGLVAPFKPKNAPKPGGNREQRRRAKREQRRN